MGQRTSTSTSANDESLQVRFTKLENAFEEIVNDNSSLRKIISVVRDDNKRLQERVIELEEEANKLGYEIVNDIAVSFRQTPAIASRCGGFLE